MLLFPVMSQMKELSTDILIIGAGPAGMAAAMELSKAKKDFIIIERSASVGGLSKTYAFKEGDLTFYTDNGPHRFFSKNPYLYEFIGDLLKEQWIKVIRQTRQFIDGKFYDYPVNAPQALRNMGLIKSAHVGFDYFWAKIVYGVFKKPVKNFEDYVIANFGRSLGDFNIINYTEKVWGIPAAEIHPDWATQRIKGLDLLAVMKDTIRRVMKKKSASGAGAPKSLVDVFYYPDQGTGLIYETIRARLEEQGYVIMLNSSPKEIQCTNGKMTKAIIDTPEGGNCHKIQLARRVRADDRIYKNPEACRTAKGHQGACIPSSPQSGIYVRHA